MESIFSSAGELAAAIRARQISAVEVVEAHLAQIERHNPALNAIVTLDAEGARARARAADQALARGEAWGRLHGVPYTLKDAHATAGLRTTTGSPQLAQHVPQSDGTVAARLKAAGGILLGKTNVPEMLADPAQTNNAVFGRTNNPWDVARTPGGSSGGAAAAVAAGLTPFDVGTDLSGSLRIPAHFCGVLSLKPTENRVSSEGLVPGLPGPRSLRLMASIGPLARTVDDLALVYGLFAGPDGCDMEVQPVPVEAPPELALKDLRVAFAPTFPGVPAAPAMRAAVEDLARRLAPAGASVEEAPLPKLDYAQDLAEAGALIGLMLGAFQPPEGGQPATLAQYLAALHRRDQSIRAWEQFFGEYDILLCPPAMLTAFPHTETGAALTVDGQPTDYWMVSAHTVLFNYTGHPAVVLPYMRDGAGLPVGVQLVGKRWGEARLLAAAKAISALTGPFQRPPGF